jgi:2-isopropylmalate synthase
MSGRTNILMKAAELGFKLTPEAPETRSITAEVKRLEGLGYEYEAAEASLALLIGKTLAHRELPFNVDGYHVSIRNHGGTSVCEATVKVRVGPRPPTPWRRETDP